MTDNTATVPVALPNPDDDPQAFMGALTAMAVGILTALANDPRHLATWLEGKHEIVVQLDGVKLRRIDGSGEEEWFGQYL